MDDRNSLSRLTEREKVCLRQWLQHKSAKEIAADLGISHHAVEKRLKMARIRLGAASSLEAARMLVEAEGYGQAVSTPLPGSEAAARQFITGIVSGTPDYAAMTPEFANFNREHLPNLRQTLLLPLGELRSIKFEDVGMMGNDEYRASFANGALIVEISLNSEGKVQGAMMRPAPTQQ